MDYATLIAFASATVLLALAPGPDNIFVLTLSLANGKKQGLATVAGLMAGCLVHTALLTLGFSVFIKENPTIFFIIKLFGAGYLLYLAFMVYKSDPAIEIKTTSQTTKGLLSLFKKGFIMNVLNPKVAIFFLAFFPGFLFSEILDREIQFLILGLLFILVSFTVFAAIALLAGFISKYLLKSSGIGVFFKWMQFVVFVGIALFLLFG